MCATSEHTFHYVALALHCDMDQHALAPYNLRSWQDMRVTHLWHRERCQLLTASICCSLTELTHLYRKPIASWQKAVADRLE